MVLLGEQVHRAATALAASRRLPEQLTHHFTRGHASAEGVHVVAVGAAEPVVLTLHRANHAGAHGFLTVVEVHEAKHLAAVVHLRALVFEASTQGHVAIEGQARVPIHAGPLGGDQGREPFRMRSEQRCSPRSCALCIRAHCDVLAHGTTCLTTDFKGRWRINGQNP